MATHGPSETAPSAKQLVFLAMLATVVAVIVFLCGVLVGRGVPARRATWRVAIEAAPGGGMVGIGVPEIADPDAEPGSPLEALSYFDRLSSTDPAPETLAAPAAAASILLQITALRSRDEARTVAAELVARGYPAFVVDPAPGGAGRGLSGARGTLHGPPRGGNGAAPTGNGRAAQALCHPAIGSSWQSCSVSVPAATG